MKEVTLFICLALSEWIRYVPLCRAIAPNIIIVHIVHPLVGTSGATTKEMLRHWASSSLNLPCWCTYMSLGFINVHIYIVHVIGSYVFVSLCYHCLGRPTQRLNNVFSQSFYQGDLWLEIWIHSTIIATHPPPINTWHALWPTPLEKKSLSLPLWDYEFFFTASFASHDLPFFPLSLDLSMVNQHPKTVRNMLPRTTTTMNISSSDQKHHFKSSSSPHSLIHNSSLLSRPLLLLLIPYPPNSSIF
mgnify:CR=1 FL=1